jgi:hypothetical protein
MEEVVDKARNDLSAAVPKFCLALEENRRTPEGRVRTSQELLATFFPHDEKTSSDRVFKYLPQDVRGPIVAAWGIRGIKAALRDSDEKIQTVVHDALIAGDLDHVAFEDGLAPETLVRWLPLADLWAFWRGGKLTKQGAHKALATAYELYLFDARWFLDTISAKGGSIRGTDVLADGLTKDELTQWIHRIHETGDGTPKGIVAALGWDKIAAKTSSEVLVAVLDAMVAKVGLTVPGKESSPHPVDDLLSKNDDKSSPDPLIQIDGEAAPSTDKPAVEDAVWSIPSSLLQQPTSHESSQSSALSNDDTINVLGEEVLFVPDASVPESKSVSRRPPPDKPPPPYRPGGSRSR